MDGYKDMANDQEMIGFWHKTWRVGVFWHFKHKTHIKTTETEGDSSKST